MMSNMRLVVSALLLCGIVAAVHAEGKDAVSDEKAMSYSEPKVNTLKKLAQSPPLEFPKESDMVSKIVDGDDNSFAPKVFPSGLQDSNVAGPPILSGSEANITELKHNKHGAKLNKSFEMSTDLSDRSVKKPTIMKKVKKSSSEQEDMLHSSYIGGHDVDEMQKPVEKKSVEIDEKKAKETPQNEIVNPSEDNHNGTKNSTRIGHAFLHTTSSMVALTSSMLAKAHPYIPKEQREQQVHPAKSAFSVILSVAAMLCIGVIGVLIWKKITMRKFRRDILINEEEFDEVSDLHSFDRAQIQMA